MIGMNETSRPEATSLICWLDDVGATDAARCGHKAAALARLRQAGLPVPDGFVIPVGSPDISAEALTVALDALGGSVAVRSSGVAEDLPDASWAGQYETVLSVQSVDALRDAIATCLASASSDRARAYGDGKTGAMAVLVQKMVPATAAGVAFSANPVTGALDEVVLSAAAGLGDKLVSGERVGDEWIIRGEEAEAIARPQDAIDAATVKRIAELTRKIARLFDAPQDIEWATDGEHIALLQARPITALPQRPDIQPPPGNWTKDASHFPDPMSPLGATSCLPTYDAAFEAMCREWGLMPDGIACRSIGHEVYTQVLPDGGDPPPWWVLALVARIAPALRKKLALAKALIDTDEPRAVVALGIGVQARAAKRARRAVGGGRAVGR